MKAPTLFGRATKPAPIRKHPADRPSTLGLRHLQIRLECASREKIHRYGSGVKPAVPAQPNGFPAPAAPNRGSRMRNGEIRPDHRTHRRKLLSPCARSRKRPSHPGRPRSVWSKKVWAIGTGGPPVTGRFCQGGLAYERGPETRHSRTWSNPGVSLMRVRNPDPQSQRLRYQRSFATWPYRLRPGSERFRLRAPSTACRSRRRWHSSAPIQAR